MKKSIVKSILLALPAALMFSCKPALHVSSDYDRTVNFSSYKTFGLYCMVATRDVSELNEARIWKSIRLEMTKKGYVENNRNPDLVINAFSLVKDKKYLSASSNMYAYGSAYRPYGFWGSGYGMSSGYGRVEMHNYKDGSLMIDIVDARTNKLVWEGTGSAEFEKQPKNPDEAISNAVTKILASFPKG